MLESAESAFIYRREREREADVHDGCFHQSRFAKIDVAVVVVVVETVVYKDDVKEDDDGDEDGDGNQGSCAN